MLPCQSSLVVMQTVDLSSTGLQTRRSHRVLVGGLSRISHSAYRDTSESDRVNQQSAPVASLAT